MRCADGLGLANAPTSRITRQLWVTLRSLSLALNKPRGVLGLAYLFGYLRAIVRRRTRVEDTAYRRFTRRELRRRMVRAAMGDRTGSVVATESFFGHD